MKILFYACCLVLLSACSNKETPAPPAPSPQPPITEPVATRFKVEGTRILDESGAAFIAKGVNVNGPYWPWPRPTLPDVPLIADVWKYNTVRLNCWPEFKIYNSNNTDMDGIVKAFTDKKVVVMIEQHNFTGKYPTAAELTELTNFWTALAAKYKNNEYVWFNIMNEPGGGGNVPADWLHAHETVIKAIRNAGAPNIIVVDEHGFRTGGRLCQHNRQRGAHLWTGPYVEIQEPAVFPAPVQQLDIRAGTVNAVCRCCACQKPGVGYWRVRYGTGLFHGSSHIGF
jgi:hypothetical protein